MDGSRAGDVITYDTRVDLQCKYVVETDRSWSSNVVYI